MKDGKGSTEELSDADRFDTSVCHVKFRKPRIDTSRDTRFEPDRDLNFDHDRWIDARLQGVVFRDHHAIGFRNIGVSNIEEVTEEDDWPEGEPATGPSSLIVERDADWDETWGRDQDYRHRWGQPERLDQQDVIEPAERIEPQLSYMGKQKRSFKKRSSIKKDRAKKKKRSDKRSRKKKEKAITPRYTFSSSNREAIEAPPSSRESRIMREGQQKKSLAKVSPKDRKRAYAFNEYALALMESGQYERAMNYFRKARDLDPNQEAYDTNKKRCQQWLDYRRRGGS